MDPIVVDLTPENPVFEMPSACMSCFSEGMTRLMLTKIPYFKEIIISSFSCENCHNFNSSVQPASSLAEKGIKYTLTVTNIKELNRQVIKSEFATITVPEIDLEIPREAQKGSSSTVEGFLTKTRDGLLDKQPERKEICPELAEQIDKFCSRLDDLLLVEKQFTFILEDPTGNSFIENPDAPKPDPLLKVEHYIRSKDDEDVLGITEMRENAQEENEEENEEENGEEKSQVVQNEVSEVITFEAMCNACGKEAVCNMKEVQIPFFKKILLMANVCDHCGYRDSEVKSAGGISEKGQRITLKMTDSDMDLDRDILKSETASVNIPELEVELTCGSLGGRFTTIEGLLHQIKDQLESINPFSFGDSKTPSDKSGGAMSGVIQGIQNIIDHKILVELIVKDPAGNSYIQNVYAPDEDPNLKVEEYERTAEDNDDLGISDMKTEGYEDDSS